MQLKILDEKFIYYGPTFDILERQIQLPTGKIITKQVVINHDFVTVIMVNDQNRVYVQDEYQAGISQVATDCITFMVGMYEEPFEAIEREIKDQIGHTIPRTAIQYIHAMDLDANFTNEKRYIYVISLPDVDQKRKSITFDDNGYATNGRWVTLDEALAQVTSMASQYGLQWYRQHHQPHTDNVW